MDYVLTPDTARQQAKRAKEAWLRAFNAALRAGYSVTIRDTGIEANSVHSTYSDLSPVDAASRYAEKYGLLSRSDVGLR